MYLPFSGNKEKVMNGALSPDYAVGRTYLTLTRGLTMKMMQGLVITLFSVLLQGYALATSIVYDGFTCLNAVDSNDPTPSITPIQSKFEVIENVGEGIYRLSLTGGIPRFVNNNQNVCIDSATAIGYAGIPAVDGLPRPLTSIDATAYFNGQELIIVISSMYTDLSARGTPFLPFTTSSVFAFTNMLIMEFNPNLSSFNLKKALRNRGFTQTSESRNLIAPFQETILPSFNETARDTPRILTPVSNIDFLLQ
ncbi:hypothetical protein [Nitrosomonas ureae]|uniref:Uncharacterized protein n=1 Tax=Nitrosomonas ureae TaxID=44577 RepID=A0A1H9FZE0_9PROT|nr:hypothetical protein [Nitrosomonas ureae]SEQ43159.1 hypothetical protein SAMN05421510_10524 [Nitrosomonas ureae]